MRFQLERHYDEVHADRYAQRRDPSKPPKRRPGCSMGIDSKVAQNQFHNRYEPLALPRAIKAILRKPDDESDPEDALLT